MINISSATAKAWKTDIIKNAIVLTVVQLSTYYSTTPTPNAMVFDEKFIKGLIMLGLGFSIYHIFFRESVEKFDLEYNN